MQSPFARAVKQALNTARKLTTIANDQASSGATYARPSTGESTTIAEIGVGRALRDDEIGDEIIIRDDEIRDFIVAVDDLLGLDNVGLGARIEPAEGDEITLAFEDLDQAPGASTGTAGVATVTYRVMRTDDGEQAWRYTDPWRTHFRIRAKRVLEDRASTQWISI